MLAAGDDTKKQKEAGDLWYDYYKTHDGFVAKNIAGRAKHWYLKAVFKLTGTDRSVTDERIREITAL